MLSIALQMAGVWASGARPAMSRNVAADEGSATDCGTVAFNASTIAFSIATVGARSAPRPVGWRPPPAASGLGPSPVGRAAIRRRTPSAPDPVRPPARRLGLAGRLDRSAAASRRRPTCGVVARRRRSPASRRCDARIHRASSAAVSESATALARGDGLRHLAERRPQPAEHRALVADRRDHAAERRQNKLCVGAGAGACRRLI